MRIRLLLPLVLWLAASPAAAAVIARVVAPSSVSLGASFDIELRASLSQPTLGWGLDLGYNGAVVGRSGLAAIGPAWVGFSAPDGDGLAGVYVPPPQQGGLTGPDVLLATVHMQALALGTTQLELSATLSDLSEGFALDPTGFDPSVQYQSAQVTVVPEPGTAALVALGLAGLAAARRRSAQA